VIVRHAQAEDGAALAELFLAARADARWFPPMAHAPGSVAPFLTARATAADHAWVAEEDGKALGFVMLHGGVVEHLYVQPSHQRRGVGAALLARAQAVSPEGLSLWCFARNAPARAFYAREGFVVVEETDGSGNEEREPDIRLAWTP
jgi:GNAT superfamily N-acetyltransferase